MWSPEKTTKLLTKVLPDKTTNLSLASFVAVMMDMAVANDIATLFLIGMLFWAEDQVQSDSVCRNSPS